MVLVYLSVAWMAGIYAASRLGGPAAAWGLLAIPALAVAALWRRRARVRLAACCALLFMLGGLRFRVALPRFDAGHVATYNGRGEVSLVGRVAAEPDVRDQYTHLTLRAETVALDGADPIETHGTVLVRAPRYPKWQYGDRVRVLGRLETPPVFAGFDYRAYLARQGVHAMVRWARVHAVPGRGPRDPRLGERLYGRLLAVKRRAQQVIARILPEPSASLLAGILLGVEQGIPADLWDAFHRTGTSHIVVISGFNMAIVGGLFSALSVRLVGRRYAAWCATAAIAGYTILVGATGAVVRAALMSLVAVWGRHVGRPYSAPNALFATALLITAWNPNMLWDLGFILSFAAVLGLLLFATPAGRGFEALLARLLPRSWVEPAQKLLYEPLVMTSCTQLTVTPLLWFHSGELSLVTLLSNALVLPLQTQVMAWGTAATLGGLLWPSLGRVLGWGAWLFLSATIAAVEWTARLPYAAIQAPLRASQARLALVVCWYAVVGGGAWLLWRTPERRVELGQALRQAWGAAFSGKRPARRLLGGLALVALLIWLAVAAQPDGRLHVSFLDLDEGDATLIRAPGGGTILVDGGGSAAQLTSRLGRLLPFWERRIQAVILAGDPGRQAGVVPVLERYHVGRLLYAASDCRGAVCAELRSRADERQIDVHEPAGGMRVDLGGPTLGLLEAGAGAVVLRLEYGETSFLLAASAGPEALGALAAGGADLRFDVLQLDARAAATREGAAFLAAVRPALLVLVGEGPEGEGVAYAGAPVLRVSGRPVTVSSDGRGYSISPARASDPAIASP